MIGHRWSNRLLPLRTAGGRFIVAAAMSAALCSASCGAILLDDTWADADRTNTNLPTDSPTYIGQSSDNGSNSVSAGSLDFALPTNSLKVWEYFTSDNSAPDGNQPHNAVTQLNVGDMLTASVSFELPEGATSASTSKNFRLGLFHDPTDARVQADVNSDGGGSGSPWSDALGYNVQLPLNATSSGNNPLQIGKRTALNSSLLGSSGAYTFAPTGGTEYALAADTVYTVQLMLNVVSASQLDVTASVLQGNTVLSTHTVSDTGSAFGGNAVSGSLPGNQDVYTNFDQLFWRNSNSTQVAGTANDPTHGLLSFTNWRVEHKVIPEPAALALAGLGSAVLVLLHHRRRA